MNDVVWGEPIEVNGVRPSWLLDDEKIQRKNPCWGTIWHPVSFCDRNGWLDVNYIRLPASHPYYTVQRYNAEHGTSFLYWPGGDDSPADWDGGRVLFNDSRVQSFIARWAHWNSEHARNVIGYTRRTEPSSATDDSNYVRVKWMTEDEWWELWIDHGVTELGECLGVIKPEPTEAERIAVKTGLTPEQVQAVLNAQSA